MKRIMNKRGFLAIAMIAIILTAAVGGTVAYIVDKTGPVENVFQPAEVTCEVTENFNETTKSEVKIKNTGDVSAYIRAAIVVTWQDGSGNVLATKPVAGTDYAMNIGSGWTPDNDGYYYYNEAVAAGDSTTDFITSCTASKAAPVSGYTLHVEIISSAIQSEGMGVTGAQNSFNKAAQ